MHLSKSILLAGILASVSTAALAQDWTAERLRGQVFQFERGDWTALERGDVVPDGRKIRTGSTGRVELVHRSASPSPAIRRWRCAMLPGRR
jgi:hypothetical protein